MPVLTALITSPVLTTPIAFIILVTPIVFTIPRQLLSDRPEVLIQAYLAEKKAWLAQHLIVRPAEYRKARK